ncbi:MAG: hypothetical protein LBK99_18915 [Opitutaceae bacterium]|jgi:hypothetical protein|nr:hypothetical protein [Opitutaceae bacterium]
MNVAETIATWRALPEEERRRICWQRIPAQVADSMAFEKEPVDIAWLKTRHPQTMPPVASKQPEAS